MQDSRMPEFVPNSRPYHQIIDYRNAKYQGIVNSNNINRDGVGLMLDHNYMLALATWRNGKIHGQSFIVYPDHSIFYGEINSKQASSIGCYQVSKKCKIFSSIGSSSEDKFVVNDCKTNSLVLVSVNRQIIKRLRDQRTTNQKALSQLYKQKGQQITIRQQNNLNNMDDKWRFIEQFFGLNNSKDYKDYRSFLRVYFSKKAQKAQNQLEIIEGKDQLQLKFRNSSIFCKISSSKATQLDYKIKILGFYNSITQRMDIFKKYHLNNTIQESVLGKSVVYTQNPLKRPQECLKRLQKYYKQSLSFVNQFVEVDYLYRIKFIYHNIETLVQHYSIQNQAQKLLQNPTLKNNQENAKTQQKFVPLELHQVKEDIYKAVQKKSRSKNKSLSQDKYLNAYQRPVYKLKGESCNQQMDSISPNKKQRSYLQEQIGTNRKQYGKRSYTYLQQNRRQIYQKQKIKNPSRNSPQTNHYGKSLSRYAYLENLGIPKRLDRNQQKMENLRNLTNYYQKVQNQLRPQNLKQTSAIRQINGNFRGPKIIQRSPGIQYSNRQRRTISQRQTQGPSISPFLPLGPRKLLKYP